jgi:predicted secreted protein
MIYVIMTTPTYKIVQFYPCSSLKLMGMTHETGTRTEEEIVAYKTWVRVATCLKN